MNAQAERTYRTERGFRRALARFRASGQLVDWYGTDHGWVIRLRAVAAPARDAHTEIAL